jgi:hypothetical protein
MSSRDRPLSRSHAAHAILLGAATGLLAAALGVGVWTYLRTRPPVLPPARESARVDLFRLPSAGAREALLVPAGPDATGEPRLAAALFPAALRELVTLVVANVSASEPWDVDLVAEPLRCRSGDGPWEDLARLDRGLPALDPVDDLRLRALGAREAQVRVEPGSLRQVLLAMPPGRKLADLTDVQWGTTALTRDSLELARLRRFREDPAGTTSGR